MKKPTRKQVAKAILSNRPSLWYWHNTNQIFIIYPDGINEFYYLSQSTRQDFFVKGCLESYYPINHFPEWTQLEFLDWL